MGDASFQFMKDNLSINFFINGGNIRFFDSGFAALLLMDGPLLQSPLAGQCKNSL